MAYDHTRGEVYRDTRGEVTPGHYANIADQVDAVFLKSPIDPVALAYSAYSRAAQEVNSMPPAERSEEMRAKVESLARDAHEAAADANEELVHD
jgi:hypothetical protein